MCQNRQRVDGNNFEISSTSQEEGMKEEDNTL